MPGKYDTDKPGSDFMTPFRLHRTVTATDVSAEAVTELLDLSESVSASRNDVHLILKQTVGAPNRLKLEFYVLLPNAPTGLANIWLLVHKTGFTAALEIIRIEALLAGTYKIRAVCEVEGGTFEIYTSTSHNPL